MHNGSIHKNNGRGSVVGDTNQPDVRIKKLEAKLKPVIRVKRDKSNHSGSDNGSVQNSAHAYSIG